MYHLRNGTSLCDVLMALMLMSAAAAWAFTGTTAAVQASGAAGRHRSALHRAELALADLHALPCDSASIARSVREPRWTLSLTRTPQGFSHRDEVRLQTAAGDTVVVQRSGWCD